jgi:hypothetical protein
MTTGKGKIIGSFEPLEGDDLIRANELKRREDRHSIQEAILRLQAETGKNFALDKAVFAGTIKSYAPGDDKDPIVCEPHQRDMREEIYWDDVIKWIAGEFPRFKYPVTLIPATPVVTAGAPGGVEPAKAGPQPLITTEIAICFAHPLWKTEKQWKKALGDKPKWLKGCIAIPGQRGKSQTRWNPVYIGAALVLQGYAKSHHVRARFLKQEPLTPWLDEWDTYEAVYL